ncbi:class I SAM-dependent methyltransferase [Streptococcus sp. CSL10205-OR2]|uniref:class I SAM-dependent methyltransferase n=1 Tax=Streptococcus sp. CSL10205-OR2 TaxID=2980558 RepID=UPI0021DB0C68|nr:class I SAM-dependent methyltransferase [Streptococcus sp. CSL10205-OR2]MCU9534070.1 class I SAM-dependent methyltransferase [Streptococcus sp. CSL10205-OR2]
MTINIENYRKMLEQPWGKIQYEITFEQLSHIKNKKILDFGSGFGLVSEFLADDNDVIAIEPNEEMLFANQNHSYKKILGSVEQLETFDDEFFDIVLCHNVLEYVIVEERPFYLEQFKRILKTDGKLSIIKHNQVGKLIQSVVFSNNIEMALGLLNNESFESVSFSKGNLYSIEDLVDMTQMTLEKYQGIRTFYSLQPNEFKSKENWLQEMKKIELAVSELHPYKDISFLQHLWLVKK